MGLFAKTGFMPGNFITVYFSPKKKKSEPKSKTYTIQCNGFYYSINNCNTPLFIGAHYTNDEIMECEEADRNI